MTSFSRLFSLVCSFRVHNHVPASPPPTPLFPHAPAPLVWLNLSAKEVWKPAFLGGRWEWGFVVSPRSVQAVPRLSPFSEMLPWAVLAGPWFSLFTGSVFSLAAGWSGRGAQGSLSVALIFSLSRDLCLQGI